MVKKRTMPIRTEVVHLDGDWKGWNLTVDKSIPFGQLIDGRIALDRADSSNPEEVNETMFSLLQLLLVDWNYVDKEGEPLPLDRKGFVALPYDLLMLTVRKAQEAVTQIPLAEGEISPSGYSQKEDSDSPIPAT